MFYRHQRDVRSIAAHCHQVLGTHAYFPVSLPYKSYQQVPRLIKFSLCLSNFINRIGVVVLYYRWISFISKFQLSSEGDSVTPEIMVTSCPRWHQWLNKILPLKMVQCQHTWWRNGWISNDTLLWCQRPKTPKSRSTKKIEPSWKAGAKEIPPKNVSP